MRERTVFSTNAAEMSYSYGKNIPVPFLMPIIKLNLKWITDLNVKAKAVKLLRRK